MSDSLEKEAERLANQPYRIVVTADETTDGEPILVLSHPELPGCMTHGTTIQEALTSLQDARREYILSLLEDGLPVPQPSPCEVVTQPQIWTSGTANATSHDTVDGGWPKDASILDSQLICWGRGPS